ncbi:hypothetical protein ZIOFF_005609 [Zingiber officinale]|uniref:Uncharacterized protein n=1 Tax=Zingiber officinale TaxID=94328 RepID=A0A8J5HX81_ZINOF|nr:hypothetical protein ZIOFF_005609 [Zingiber officinale]
MSTRIRVCSLRLHGGIRGPRLAGERKLWRSRRRKCAGVGPLPPYLQHRSNHEEGRPREQKNCKGRQGVSSGVRLRVHQLRHQRVSRVDHAPPSPLLPLDGYLYRLWVFCAGRTISLSWKRGGRSTAMIFFERWGRSAFEEYVEPLKVYLQLYREVIIWGNCWIVVSLFVSVTIVLERIGFPDGGQRQVFLFCRSIRKLRWGNSWEPGDVVGH